MFRGSSLACSFALLILLLASFQSLVSCDDEEGAEDAADEVESFTEAEHDEANPPSEGNADECLQPGESTKEMCCKSHIRIDDVTMKCLMLHQKNIPKGNPNPAVAVKFLSCFVECIYKKKKYMGKGDTLNMKVIKSDANKLYKDENAKKDHMIEMYEHCERHAVVEWGKIKKNPAGKALFAGSCKPYFMFVYICEMDYGKISCPYFVWQNTKDHKAECEDLKTKCTETHG